MVNVVHLISFLRMICATVVLLGWWCLPLFSLLPCVRLLSLSRLVLEYSMMLNIAFCTFECVRFGSRTESSDQDREGWGWGPVNWLICEKSMKWTQINTVTTINLLVSMDTYYYETDFAKFWVLLLMFDSISCNRLCNVSPSDVQLFHHKAVNGKCVRCHRHINVAFPITQ